jgi:hypothetical protein
MNIYKFRKFFTSVGYMLLVSFCFGADKTLYSESFENKTHQQVTANDGCDISISDKYVSDKSNALKVSITGQKSACWKGVMINSPQKGLFDNTTLLFDINLPNVIKDKISFKIYGTDGDICPGRIPLVVGKNSLSYDLAKYSKKYKLGTIKYIWIFADKPKNDFTFYLDNIRVIGKGNNIQPLVKVNKTANSEINNIIESFEDTTYKLVTANSDCMVAVSDKYATSGKKSLKIMIKGKQLPSWSGIMITAPHKSSFDNKELTFNIYLPNEIQDKIKIKIYGDKSDICLDSLRLKKGYNKFSYNLTKYMIKYKLGIIKYVWIFADKPKKDLVFYLDNIQLKKKVLPKVINNKGIDHKINISITGRRNFLRFEPDAAIICTVKGIEASANMYLTVNSILCGSKKIPLSQLSNKIKLDSSVREGEYKLPINISANNQVIAKHTLVIYIAPRPLPLYMPVVNWEIYGKSTKLMRAYMKDTGFTHFLGEPSIEHLDKCLKLGLGVLPGCGPTTSISRAKYSTVDRDGKPNPRRAHTICGNNDEVIDLSFSITKKRLAEAISHPALRGALVNSEVRDHNQFCFCKHCQKLFKTATGLDIPKKIYSRKAFDYKTIKNFPKNKIIPDDFPIYRYYKWFWKNGDGWNRIDTATDKAVKDNQRRDIWTFTDPAVRCLSEYGYGGTVDVLSTWMYPGEPLRVGYSADEVINMCSAEQKVPMQMTQLIMKMSIVSPLKNMPAVQNRNFWETYLTISNGTSGYIGTPADLIAIAFWSKISRPIKGIMYHGWRTIFPVKLQNKAHNSYLFSAPPGAREVLRNLFHSVIQPLGPTLLQVPDRKSNIAFFENFTSELFTSDYQPISASKTGWRGDLYEILRYAQLQPQVIFEERIINGGLKNYDVLVMPNSPILTQKTVNAIQQFINNGGIIIGDEFLNKTIIPDITISSLNRSGNAMTDNAMMLATASELRTELDPLYRRFIDSSNPKVVTRVRSYRSGDYLFILNDTRSYGNYIGQYHKVMEKGIPASSTISIRRENCHIYDLIAHREIATKKNKTGTIFKVNLAGAEGRLFMVLTNAINNIIVDIPKIIHKKEQVILKIKIVDKNTQVISAVIPLKVKVVNPKGIEVETSGYYGAKDGKIQIPIDFAVNDKSGQWTVKVTELASGLSISRKITVIAVANEKSSKKKNMSLYDFLSETYSSEALLNKALKDAHGNFYAATMSPFFKSQRIKTFKKLLRPSTTLSEITKELFSSDIARYSIAWKVLIKRINKGKSVQQILEKCLRHTSGTIRLAALNILAQSRTVPNASLEKLLITGTVADRLGVMKILRSHNIEIPSDIMRKLNSTGNDVIKTNIKKFYLPNRKTPNIKDTYDQDMKVGKAIKLPSDNWLWCKDTKNIGLIEKWQDKDFSTLKCDKIPIEKFWPKYLGIAWYCKKITLPPMPKKKPLAVELHFGAVDEECWVWINGKFAGAHALGLGGWNQPFDIDVTNYLKWNSDNKIVIRVKNVSMAGGIWKPIQLYLYYWK